LINDIPVRAFNKRTTQWEIPIEGAADVVSRFEGIPEVSIDPIIIGKVNRHNELIASKFSIPPLPEHDSLIKSSMLDHQKYWLGFSRHFKAVANLCEQGTGKSKMALDWVAIKHFDLVLLVAKNSNVYKWAVEVKKHSDFEPYILKGTKQERLDILHKAVYDRKSNATSIVIINYEYVQPLLQSFLNFNFDALILDESTAIKNTSTKRHKAIIKLGDRCPNKLILTGTPLVNSPMDAFGQLRFINKNILGSNFITFKSRYCIMGGYGGYQAIGYKNLEELKDKIERYSYRVLKKTCLDLPDKIIQILDVEPTQEFKKRYKELIEAELIEVEDRFIDNTLMLTKINRLQQLCDGFMYTDSQAGQYNLYGSPKLDELVDFMDDHFQSNGKLIIWAKYKATIKILYERLRTTFPKVTFDCISGETPVNVRQNLLDAFNDTYIPQSQMRCLILQTASMMHGVDIRCDTAVYYSLSWSNEEWLQSQDRIHGINRGEGNKCTYIVLSIPGTIERSIYKALERKKKLSDFVLNDVSDIRNLFTGGGNGL